MITILFVRSRKATFIELDRELLAKRYTVIDWYQPGRRTNPVKLARLVRRADVVVGWWASWHTFWPFTLAPLLGTPSLLIVGGFDIAAERDIGYGYQLGGARKHLSRWIIRRATKLMTNSEYSREEFARNVGLPASRVTVVHHGVPDLFGALPAPKERLALTVGNVDGPNLERKGLRAFVQAAAELPDVEFVVVGKWFGEAASQLQEIATPNVRLAGYVSDEELLGLYRRAAVYVQASQHEGFGISVAEAMLGGCVPVVSRAGALPEVVGEAGILLPDRGAPAVAAGVGEALERGPDAGAEARERILTLFPVALRRDGLVGLVEDLLRR
jgi:glycosyltransferase involved in cell wall biosynthesis